MSANEILVSMMPKRLTGDDIDAVRRDPLCAVEDKDEFNKRIGWLICAYDAIVAVRTKNLNYEAIK